MEPRQIEILSSLYNTPEYYVRGLDEDSRNLVIHRMSRQSYGHSSFLNVLLIDEDDLFDLLPLDQTLKHHQASAPAPSPVHFIFHFSFCGSTLLSRGLDYPGYTMVYREPYILHQISHYLRFPELHNLPARELLAFGISCAQRTFIDSEIPIVKTTDSCSNLVEDSLRFHKASKGIVLYNSLDTFLLSTLKSSGRRYFIRGHLKRAEDDLKSAGIDLSFKAGELTDAQLNGYVWFSLMHRYRTMLNDASLPLYSLKMDSLVNFPIPVLHQVLEYLDLKVPPNLIDKMVKKGAFRSDSKHPHKTFDPSNYQVKQNAFRTKLGEEIEEGKAWVAQLRNTYPIDDELPRPLFSESSPLF